MFLPVLGDIRLISSYFWGSACLAWLYKKLFPACRAGTREIARPLLLLQLWIWEQCPFIAPEQPVAYIDPMPQGTLGMRWRVPFEPMEAPMHVVSSYHLFLEEQAPTQWSVLGEFEHHMCEDISEQSRRFRRLLDTYGQVNLRSLGGPQ